MKKFIKLLFFLICANLTYAQVTFDFTSGSVSNPGGQVVQTLSGITLTVTTDPSGNANLTSYGGVAGTTGNVAVANINVTSLILTFGTNVNISSIHCFDNSDPYSTRDWRFHPNTGSDEVRSVNGDAGQTITGLNFVGISSITITIDGGGSDAFGIENVFHDPSLPVELTSFLSILTLNSVKLKWETATEVNNYGFEIHRIQNSEVSSQNGKDNWEVIGFVEGHGNSNSPKKYAYEDKTYTAGKIYKYRLKQIDFDGAYEYSDELIVETTVPDKTELAQNYPNPFNPSTTIKFSMPEADFANLTVYNSIGEKVAVLINENLEAGFYTYLFDGSKLASGAYVYKLETAGRIITKKMLLVK